MNAFLSKVVWVTLGMCLWLKAGAQSTLTFETPSEGAVFFRPDRVAMTVTAVDPESEIRRVEFYAGDKRLGVSEILTRDAIFPGRPRSHSFTWTNPPVGVHALRARARDSADREVVSAVRKIRVQEVASIPVINLFTQNRYAVEGEELNAGYVAIQRDGVDLTQPVTVGLQFGGTAQRGVDYEVIVNPCWPCDRVDEYLRGNEVTLQSGVTQLRLGILAIKDLGKTESEPLLETVILSLLPPLGPDGLNTRPSYEVGPSNRAELLVVDRGHPDQPLLAITRPGTGAEFPAGSSVELEAIAIDPVGSPRRVVFYAGDQVIGVSEITTEEVDIPGRLRVHRLTWKNVPKGEHVLSALAQIGPDPKVESQAVTIHVGGPDLKPSLTILHPEAGAVVSPTEFVRVVAVGVGRFGGITDVELLLGDERIAESHVVFIRPPEANEPVEHVFEVRIPAGERVLRVRDLADPAVVSPAIKIRSVLPQGVATLKWVAPPAGAQFPWGRPIQLEVSARDPDGLLFHVDFYADELKIGGSDFDCPECRLIPGATLTHRFDWNNAPVGEHRIQATARDASGHLVVSELIPIEVTGTPPPHLSAVRTLPDNFQPGQKFFVTVEVKVSDAVQNYVVEDFPPFAQIGGAVPPPELPHWTVTAVSDDGVFDGPTGVVKFGPFFDAVPRILKYEITPNDAEVELAEFTGRIVADGVASEIGGDQVMTENRRHPADRDPADDSLNAIELTAYGAAWKLGYAWEVGPNPVPMDYVTWAAHLWRQGEHYRFDPSVGPPPLWWVSDPFLPPAPPPEEEGAIDSAGQPRFRGVALRWEVPVSDQSRSIAVRVYPAPGTTAYAVEEGVTEKPGDVSGGGVYDEAAKVIRWGPFLDRVPRTLTYRLAGSPPDRPVQGAASFDGTLVSVQSAHAPEAQGPRLICVETLKNGGRQVVLEDGELMTGAEFELEVSSNLSQWTRVGRFLKVQTAGFARDDAPATEALFYRAVRVK